MTPYRTRAIERHVPRRPLAHRPLVWLDQQLARLYRLTGDGWILALVAVLVLALWLAGPSR